jgi:nucleoid DNA-binding protein
MKKNEIASQWALQSGVSRADAADHLDRAVRQIVAELRARREAALPGFGKLVFGADGRLLFEPERGKPRG